jgi:hypothetical protein
LPSRASCLYTGQTAVAPRISAVDATGYLTVAITLGLTTSCTDNSSFGTNYIQFGASRHT